MKTSHLNLKNYIIKTPKIDLDCDLIADKKLI